MEQRDRWKYGYGMRRHCPTKLYSWQKRCPFCGGTGLNPQDPDFIEGWSNLPCHECNGTGLISVLDDSVTVPCSNWHTPFPNSTMPRNCAEANCPGYTLSTRYEDWMAAIFKAWPKARIEILAERTRIVLPGAGLAVELYFDGKGEGLPALQSALNQIREKEQADA